MCVAFDLSLNVKQESTRIVGHWKHPQSRSLSVSLGDRQMSSWRAVRHITSQMKMGRGETIHFPAVSIECLHLWLLLGSRQVADMRAQLLS